jgi:hypothetical protein
MFTEPREAFPRSSTYESEQPGWIDLTTVYQGKPGALYTQAIFSIQGGTLTYCVAPPGQPRPTDFVTAEGDEYTLVVLKRAPSESSKSLAQDE